MIVIMGIDKTCANCIYWQPNGGLLGVGFCKASKWSYRKPTQSCNKHKIKK